MPVITQNSILTRGLVRVSGMQDNYRTSIDETIVPTAQLLDMQKHPDKTTGWSWWANTSASAVAARRGALCISGVTVGLDVRIEVNRCWMNAGAAGQFRLTLVDADTFANDMAQQANQFRPIFADQPAASDTTFQRAPIVFGARDIALADLPNDQFVRTFHPVPAFSSIDRRELVIDPPAILWPGRMGLSGLNALAMIFETDNVVISGGFTGKLYWPNDT